MTMKCNGTNGVKSIGLSGLYAIFIFDYGKRRHECTVASGVWMEHWF